MYRLLPMFQRIGPAAYKPSLENTIKLLDCVGNPHLKLKFVHVAGTNGKGSVCNMLSAIFQSEGYKTGLYTSPHLLDFRERIKVNGQDISKEAVVHFISTYKENIESIKPSFFELCVALAMNEFLSQGCEMVILETGMGGRLDSTNVVLPLISIITNISYDHQQFLGDTLTRIASEKAGIIKPETPVLIGKRQDETQSVFAETSDLCKAELYYAEDLCEITFKEDETGLSHLSMPFNNRTITIVPSLKGLYQKENIRTVVAAIKLLNQKGIHIHAESIQKGISHVQQITGFAGRWEVMQEKPMLVLDTAHNEDGIKNLLKQVMGVPYKNLCWVWGMVADKDPNAVINLLPKDARYYLCRPDLPRAMDTDRLQAAFHQRKLFHKTYSSTREALFAALCDAEEQDLILVAGSTFTVAEALGELRNSKHQ